MGCAGRLGLSETEPHSLVASGESAVCQVAFQQMACSHPDIAECVATGVVIWIKRIQHFSQVRGGLSKEPSLERFPLTAHAVMALSKYDLLAIACIVVRSQLVTA